MSAAMLRLLGCVLLASLTRAQYLRASDPTAETRIVGGNDASAGEFPWFVSSGACGGSLVARDMVLSAAHCASSFKTGKDIIIGSWQKWQTDGGAEWSKIESDPWIPDDYSMASNHMDFLLVKITPVSADRPLAPLNANDNVPTTGDDLMVIGFGATEEGGYSSSTLQKVTVEAVDHNTCNNLYNNKIYESSMLCAGVSGGGKDSCQGDSGGPLFTTTGVQVGVVSWGEGCARPDKPGVYSKISGKIDWLQETICENSQYPPSYCSSGQPEDTTDATDADPPTEGAANTSEQTTIGFRYYMQYDNEPDKINWYIKDLQSGKRLVDFPRFSVKQAKAVRQAQLTLVPGQDYIVGIRSWQGDGMGGQLRIMARSNGQQKVLVRIGGNFGDAKFVQFTAPDSI